MTYKGVFKVGSNGFS